MGVETDARTLQRKIQRLQRENASLRRWVERTGQGLDGMLARRGLRVHRSVPPHRLILDVSGLPSEIDRLYRLLQRYSFRLLLRDVIRLREGFGPEDLTGYCSLRAAHDHLRDLDGLGVIERGPLGRYHFSRSSVTSFGETLEWFVAEILRREFFAQAIHGVAFRTPPPGGDFDVIACLEGLLLYVETKSSPPRGIEAEEMAGFLDRHRILAPHVALFFVDTHLRMRDKMVPILEEAMGGAPRDSGRPPKRVLRLEREIFHVDHRIYLLNASRGIVSNLRCCLLDYLRNQRTAPTQVLSPPGRDTQSRRPRGGDRRA